MAKKLNIKTVLERFKKVHKDRYDYSLVDYKSSRDKVKIICKKHGVFEQIVGHHFKGSNCPKCANKERGKKLKKNTEEFIKEATNIHGEKYDYKLVDYKSTDEKIKIICERHGIFRQTPAKHIKGFGCSKCKIDMLAETNKVSFVDFVKRAYELHDNKFKYKEDSFNGMDKSIKIICNKHGEFQQKAYSHLQGFGCKECYYESKIKIPRHLLGLSKRIRSNVSKAFSKKGLIKDKSCFEILGCNWAEFKSHLEDNPYGFKVDDKHIHLDHIIPMAEVEREKDVYKLNHFSNFQLLPKYYNSCVKKDKKWDKSHFENWLNNLIPD